MQNCSDVFVNATQAGSFFLQSGAEYYRPRLTTIASHSIMFPLLFFRGGNVFLQYINIFHLPSLATAGNYGHKRLIFESLPPF